MCVAKKVPPSVTLRVGHRNAASLVIRGRNIHPSDHTRGSTYITPLVVTVPW